MSEHLFEDDFVVISLDPDGKKFDKVSRVEAKNDDGSMYMQLDVAIEVHPMHKDGKFKMVLAETLNLDGTPDIGYFTQAGRETLADKFQYVMQGKLYKIADYTPPPPPEKGADTSSNKDADTTSSNKDAETSSDKGADTSNKDAETSKNDADTSKNDADTSNQDPKMEVFASFGGLLMVLRGDPSFAKSFKLDQRIFLLIRNM